MKKTLMSGNQAVAQGALEAGIKVAASYPGTPASEILEAIASVAKERGIHAEWSVNEKVAFEVALGAAISGSRAICSMKCAGINWIVDMLMTVGYTGVRGGLVIAVADDPGASYSSNEQDSRFLGLWAKLPCLEPSEPQEAKEMTAHAFELSERLELPVILRLVTAVSHCMSDVEVGEFREPTGLYNELDWKRRRWNVYSPPGQVEKHRWLLSRFAEAQKISEDLKWNLLEGKKEGRLLIVCSGIGFCYAREALGLLGMPENVSILKVSCPVPAPVKKISEVCKSFEKVLVVEEGDSVLELQLRAAGIKTNGKMSGDLPAVGSLSPGIVAESVGRLLGVELRRRRREDVVELPPRSQDFCPGCPHLGSYWALRQALRGRRHIVNGDIGCYEMAGYGGPSEKAVGEVLHTNYIMGGGIGLMQGEFHSGREEALIAVTGDSTFFHACVPAVANAVLNGVKGLFLILDNSTTAMTGQHPSPASGETATGEKTVALKVEDFLKACGVKSVRVMDPYDIRGATEAIREALGEGVFAAVIARRACALKALKEGWSGEFGRVWVDEEKCTGCRACVDFGCPAILLKNGKAMIDDALCIGCGMCIEVCPAGAIEGSK